MTRTAGNSWFFQILITGGLVALASSAFLNGQVVSEPVAIRRKPVDKTAIPRPAASAEAEEGAQPSSASGKEAAAKEKKSEKDSAAAVAKKAGEKTGGSEAEETEVPEGAIPPRMGEMFPVGRPFYGVRIPSYAGDSLNSVVTSEVMKRVDEEHLDMERLEIRVYTDGEPDAKILMDKAIYDMTDRKLTSRRTPPEILQSKFKMVGDKMTFDSETRIGHMTGNVKMTIFNVESFLSESDMTGGAGK